MLGAAILQFQKGLLTTKAQRHGGAVGALYERPGFLYCLAVDGAQTRSKALVKSLAIATGSRPSI
jgi:hypothetical protein